MGLKYFTEQKVKFLVTSFYHLEIHFIKVHFTMFKKVTYKKCWNLYRLDYNRVKAACITI